MQFDQRVVTLMPLREIWDLDGTLPCRRLRDIGREQIATMLRSGPILFVVANCGHALRWLPIAEAFEFWKAEIKPHIVEPDAAQKGFQLKDFPGEYCYTGSEWSGSVPIVLLEMHH